MIICIWFQSFLWVQDLPPDPRLQGKSEADSWIALQPRQVTGSRIKKNDTPQPP